jgi:hypothetical protein
MQIVTAVDISLAINLKKPYMNTTFRVLVICLLMSVLSSIDSHAQTSVYVCSTNGAYGFCYGTHSVANCAYNKCIEAGGTTPYSILFVNSKGYGAIAVGRDYNGAQVVGASAGYSSQAEADNRAVAECANRGGQSVYISYRFLDR